MSNLFSKYKSVAASLVLGLSLAMTTSCTDYLDKAPESDVSADAAFKNFMSFQGFTEELYLCMPDFTKRVIGQHHGTGAKMISWLSVSTIT